ncbi:MAG: hypothetical protein JKY65_10685 [Planctomycetes bacterium]|nr:hypothetical protein [Planctomycetota bacterium]
MASGTVFVRDGARVVAGGDAKLFAAGPLSIGADATLGEQVVTSGGGLALCASRITLGGSLSSAGLVLFATHGPIDVRSQSAWQVAGPAYLAARGNLTFRSGTVANVTSSLHIEAYAGDSVAGFCGRARFDDAQVNVGGNFQLEAGEVLFGPKSALRVEGTSEIYAADRFELGRDATIAASVPGSPERISHPDGALAFLALLLREDRPTTALLAPGSTFVGCLHGYTAQIRVEGGDGALGVGLAKPGVYGAIAGDFLATNSAVIRFDAHVGRFVGDVRGLVFTRQDLGGGRVVDVPQAGVRVSALDIDGQLLEAMTDVGGEFVLEGLPGPQAVIVADGAALGYGRVSLRVKIERQSEALAPRPWILLPLVEGATFTLTPGGATTAALVLTNPAVPEASLTIAAGTQLVFPPDLEPNDFDSLSIYELPLSALPAAFPDGQVPVLALGFQPEGLEVVEGFDVTFPNPDSRPAGESVDVYQFDPGLGEWVVKAQGTVSPDGLRIEATLNTFLYPAAIPGAGQILLVRAGGIVVDAITSDPVVGATVLVQGRSAETIFSGVFIHGDVFGRVGDELEFRVTVPTSFSAPAGCPETATFVARARVVVDPTNPARGLLDVAFPFTIRFLRPICVLGRVVTQSGLPVSCIPVTANGVTVFTDQDGDYLMPAIPVELGGAPGSLQPFGVVATRSFVDPLDPPNLLPFQFTGSVTVGVAQYSPGTALPAPPIVLSGPTASAGNPGVPGTGGILNDPINDAPAVSPRLPFATLTQANGSSEDTGLIPLGLEYNCFNRVFYTVNAAGFDSLMSIQFVGPGAGQWTTEVANFGAGFSPPSGGVSRDATNLTLVCDPSIVPGGPLTPTQTAALEEKNFAYAVSGEGRVFRFKLARDNGGRVLGWNVPSFVFAAGASFVAESDPTGGLFLGRVNATTANTDWRFLSPSVDQYPPGQPAVISSTPRQIDDLTLEPGTGGRYWLGSSAFGFEEVDLLSGQSQGQYVPGVASRLFWPAFAPFQDANGGGQNIYGVRNLGGLPTPQGPSLAVGPFGDAVVAIKRATSPNVVLGDPHVAGAEVVLYRSPAPSPGAEWRITGLTFGEKTGDPAEYSLYVLETNIQTVTQDPATATPVTVRIRELQYNFRTTFSGGTFGTPGTPPTPAVPDSNGDGLIDAIEIALYGALLPDDGDGLTTYQELVLLGTDPQSSDTDGDGYPDQQETAARSDPKDANDVPTPTVSIPGDLNVPPATNRNYSLSILAGGLADPFTTSRTLTISGNATFSGGATSISVAHGGGFVIEGGAQGFAAITASGGTIPDVTFTLAIRDVSFQIAAQCAVRNCPCTACSGTADKQDGAFVNLSSMVGGFMWKLEVLPHTLGRNGLAPAFHLKTNSRAHSRGGWFGTTPATIPCFERIVLEGGRYVYYESGVRRYAFDLRPVAGTPGGGSPLNLEGATARARYEVLKDLGGEIVLRKPNGARLKFYPLSDGLRAGALKTVENRFGDRIEHFYNSLGQLETVTGVYGRQWRFTYDASGRLERIAEQAGLRGRAVGFVYDAQNRLLRINTTGVTTTVAGNGGVAYATKPYVLLYPDTLLPSPLPLENDLSWDTNLAGIVYPREVLNSSMTPRFRNGFGGPPSSATPNDRIASQIWGDSTGSGVVSGGTLSYSYGVGSTTVIDRNGNRTVYAFNGQGLATSVTEQSNRDVRGPGVDPDFLTQRTYNVDEQITDLILPAGNRVQSTFDDGDPNRYAHGNVLELRRIADSARGDGQGLAIQDIVTTYRYEPIFQQVRLATSARGNHPPRQRRVQSTDPRRQRQRPQP